MDSRQEGARYALLLSCLIYAVGQIDKSISNTVRAAVQKDLHLTNTEVAVPDTVFNIAYMAFGLIAGAVLDMGVNRRLIIGTGLVLWSAATSLTAFASNLTALVAFRGIVGLGEGIVHTTLLPFLADFYPALERQLVFAVLFMALTFGGSQGYIIGGTLAGAYGWRNMYLLCGLPGFVLALGLPFVNEPTIGINDAVGVSAESPSGERQIIKGVLEVLAYPHFVFALIATTLESFGGVSGFLSFLPTYLTRYDGFTVEEAGVIIGSTTLIGGLFGNLLGAKAVLFAQNFVKNAGFFACSWFVLLSALATCSIINLTITNSSALFALLILWAMFASMVNGPSSTLSVNAMPVHLRGRAQGVWALVTKLFGASPAPIIVGDIADSHDLAFALQITWIVQIMSALAWWSGYWCTAPLHEGLYAAEKDQKEAISKLTFTSLLCADAPDRTSLQDSEEEGYGTLS